jgi:hypothetical protein
MSNDSIKVEKGKVVPEATARQSLELDKSVAEAPKAKEEKKEVKVPITAETQFELEILQLERQACEADKLAVEARLAKIQKTIEFKTQRILATWQLQQEAIKKSQESGVVIPAELKPKA